MSKFIFDTTCTLSKAENKDYYEIEGLASTNDKDLEGEIIEQNFDLSAIKEGKGYLNCDHGHNYENKDHARIGVIDDAKITPKGLWIKGKVWKNHPEAGIYHNEMKYKPELVKFSVEGFTVSRDPNDKKRVKRAFVTGVALTRNPVNPNTFTKLLKSLSGKTEELPFEPKTSVIKSHNIHYEKNGDQVSEVIITKVLDPNHEDFHTVLSAEKESMAKGGTGSGRKKTGVTEAQSNIIENEERQNKYRQEKQDRDEDRRRRKRQSADFDRELQEARESAPTKEAAKRNVRELMQRRKLNPKKRRLINVQMRKSLLKEEYIRRAKENPEFRKSLEEILSKALVTGGPAYASQPAVNMTQGQVMQQEGLEKQPVCTHEKEGTMCDKCKKQ
jgi:hypothetical protein